MTTTFAAAQEANAEAGGEVGMALPGAAPTAGAAQGESDHDTMIGRLAVGYLGRDAVPLGGGQVAPGGPGITFVQAPIIGIRYWIDQMLGLDIGVGFFTEGGSSEFDPGGGAPSQSDDVAGRTAFAIHGGIPLSLASDGHFSFQIVPELNLGYATQTQDIPGGELTNTGFGMDLGARVGAEIHFGFIGVPQLALQGTVGARFEFLNVESKAEVGGVTSTATTTANQFHTTVEDEPWDIFTGSIAALYYF
jgi:hypothetical protein